MKEARTMIQWLLRNGWTQTEIAKAIGRSQPTVQAIASDRGVNAATMDAIRDLYDKQLAQAKLKAR